MRAIVQFVRKRGWSQVAMLLVGVAAIVGAILSALLGSSLGSPYVLVFLCIAGAILIISALICMFIGPAERSPDAGAAEASPDPGVDGGSRDAEDVARVGLEVPPDTPVRFPKGLPPGTGVQIDASEELENDGEGSKNDEPPDP